MYEQTKMFSALLLTMKSYKTKCLTAWDLVNYSTSEYYKSILNGVDGYLKWNHVFDMYKNKLQNCMYPTYRFNKNEIIAILRHTTKIWKTRKF